MSELHHQEDDYRCVNSKKLGSPRSHVRQNVGRGWACPTLWRAWLPQDQAWTQHYLRPRNLNDWLYCC